MTETVFPMAGETFLPTFSEMLFSPQGAVAAVIFLALILYLLTGGADFGAGMWDLFAKGPRKLDQRKLIETAMAPIWEVNHIWIILIIVLLFTCFPKAFFVILTTLHIPITLMLIGIVLRGGAFVLRQYSLAGEKERAIWGRVFSFASLLTPVFLSISAAALLRGKMEVREGVPQFGFVDPWWGPFGLCCGLMLVSLCAHISAVYLCVEATGRRALQADFRIRALASGLVLPISGWGALLVARTDATRFADRLSTNLGLGIQLATAICGLCLFGALVTWRFRVARLCAGSLVVLVVSGFAFGLFPYLVFPTLPLGHAAAPEPTLQWVLVFLAAGGVVLVPSLVFLFRVFSPQKAN